MSNLPELTDAQFLEAVCYDLPLGATRERLRSIADRQRRAASEAQPEDIDYWYCESVRLVLHPGKLYRFKVDPECATCARMAAHHDATMRGENPAPPPEFAPSPVEVAPLSDAEIDGCLPHGTAQYPTLVGHIEIRKFARAIEAASAARRG